VIWARKFRSGLFSIDILESMETRSSQLIEVGNNLIFTTYAYDSLGKENLVLIKTDLNGESVSPCIDNLLLEFSWQIVNDPLFYPLDLSSTSMDIKEVTLFSQGIDFELNLLKSCAITDTIYSIIDTTICKGEIVEGYDTSGIYSDTFKVNSGCDSIRILNLTVLPIIHSLQQVQICQGESYEGYDKSGIYLDTFPSPSGCDSIRTLRLNVINCMPIVAYDLDPCRSYMIDGSHMDYSEFTPEYLNILPCADVTAGYLFRDPPANNKHSCTPGIEDSPAMCVTTLNSCTYVAGNEASVIIEVTIDPEPDSVVILTGLEFYEKSPTIYSWIDGGSGPNNYPRFYGIRILRNGIEIFRQTGIQTTTNWTLQTFDFIDDDLFRVDVNTAFRIELLPYCPVGNGAEVSAWDLDEIKIYAGCVPIIAEKPIINGNVLTREGLPISNAIIYLADNPAFSSAENKITDDEGYYVFDNLEKGTNCFLKGYKNDDVLNGVSTLDLIRIQKHLLGIEPFTSLHQYIAADINRSANVSVIDLLDLRKVLLGIYTDFPRNTSWRFGPMPQDMEGTELSSFKEIKSLEYITNDTQEVNFIGIKVGDLNDDIQLPAQQGKVEPRHEKEMTLWAEDEQIKEDIPFTIDVKLGDHAIIAGMQMAFRLQDLKLISVEGKKLPVTSEHFSTTQDGIFRLSCSQPEAINISENEVLFSLTLVSHHSGSLADRIQLAKEILASEAYSSSDLDLYRLSFEIGNPMGQKPEISFFEVEPNPLQSLANIHFTLVSGGKTLIRFYDVSGRIIHVMEKVYAAGEHIEQIRNNDFISVEGVIYCQLICNGDTRIVRVIKLK